MRSVAEPYSSRRIAGGALALVLIAGMVAFIPAYGSQSGPPTALDKAKSIAGTQHEIVVLLIKQKEFQKAAAEANKIFEMKWPENQEPLLLKELLFLSGQFLLEGQAPLGMQVIEKNCRFFKSVPSQIEIWKEKGYLYKNMNQNDKAIDCFRKAQELEGSK
jgi:tetratricopeptide (TPR) repeat protein